MRAEMAAAVIARDWFESWRDPGEFYRAADENLGRFFLADKNPPQYLRDAYVVGVFARIWRDDQGPCEVRLIPEADRFPDAQFRAGDKNLDLEATIADEKDRPMFKEWRKTRAKIAMGEIVLAKDSATRQADAREAIPRVCKEKAERYGRTDASLVIFVGAGPALSAEEMIRLTEPWKDSFSAIYLVCGMDAVRAWPERQILRGREPF